MHKFYRLVVCLLAFGVTALWSQQPYGVGDNVEVPYVAPGTLTMDGNLDESAWQNAAPVDMIAYWEGEWSGHPVADVAADARLLWTEDTLFVMVIIEDYQPFYFGPDTAAWWGEQILIGIDRSLAGDRQTDDSWGGWPQNVPDQGPTVFKIYDKGITSNWGFAGISPLDSGWTAGTVFVDNDNFTWGVEMKVWAPQVRSNSMIGFNIGGATASTDTTFDLWPEGTYAYFCWHPQPSDVEEVGYPEDYLAGDLMRRGQSYGTLTFIGGPRAYGVGDVIDVPYVAPNTLAMDGVADEPAWATARMVDILAYWEGEWSGHPVPDVDAQARVLWTEDTLFTYVKIEDYQPFYFGPDTAAWWGEQILVGVDGRMYGDPPGDMYDGDWGGAPWNLPDLGPTVFKIYDKGVTSNWGFAGISPLDSGWTAGTVFVDNDNFIWGVEMKTYLPQVAFGTRVGFNIGGATASTDTTFDLWPEGTYAYFCWHPQPSDVDNGYPEDYLAGDLMRRAQSFGTLSFGPAVGIGDQAEERSNTLPKIHALYHNYPNPFNPSTRIVYALNKPGLVQLEVYNLLGQKVSRLINTKQVAGTHEVTWEAGNLSSGVYFYQLKVDGQVIDTKKALLMR